MKNRIRIARGTKAQLTGIASVIPAGVPIYTTDENKLYVSDGTKTGVNITAVNAANADTATNATNATNLNASGAIKWGNSSINISTIFENNSATVKNATKVGNTKLNTNYETYAGGAPMNPPTDLDNFEVVSSKSVTYVLPVKKLIFDGASSSDIDVTDQRIYLYTITGDYSSITKSNPITLEYEISTSGDYRVRRTITFPKGDTLASNSLSDTFLNLTFTDTRVSNIFTKQLITIKGNGYTVYKVWQIFD